MNITNLKYILFSILALILLSISVQASAKTQTGNISLPQWVDVNSPLGKNERPRIFINPETLSVIASKATGSHAVMYADLKTRADELLTTAPEMGSYSTRIYNRTAMLSLVALVEKTLGNPYNIYRDRAFFYAQYVLSTTDSWALTSKWTGQSYGIRGRAGALSLVYDWLYSDMTPSLKIDIHNFLINVYKGLHNIDRPSGLGQVRKSVYGSNYWLEWGSHPWFSISLYGDGLGDETIIGAALNDTNNEVENFMVKGLNMLGGAMHNGWGYQLGDGDMSFAYLNLWAWEFATAEPVFTDSFAIRGYPEYFLHASKPDGALIKINDTFDRFTDPVYPYGTGKWSTFPARAALIVLMDIYNDGYAKYIVDKAGFRISGNGAEHLWKNLIFYDVSVQEEQPSQLPSLVKFYPQTGILFGRSGWTSDDLYYTFRNRDQYGSHTDSKQNSFTIYYKSPLAINDGNYPPGASGADSTKSYYRSTISSNSMLVYDPSETFYNFRLVYNSGGQKIGSYDAVEGTGGYQNFDSYDYDQTAFDASENNTADNEFEDGEGYTYIKGDATRGYTSKVTHYVREFVHIQNNYFVIFDRVGSPDQNFSKKWLLHSLTEPVLNGVEDFTCVLSLGEAACQGDTDAGISKSYDSNEAIITNGDGRLFSKTLLPENSVTRKIGGIGYKFWIDDADQNIPPSSYTESVTGGWRLEISPQTPDNDADGESMDYFLHVLHSADATESVMVNSIKIQSNQGDMVGAHIQDVTQNIIALFSNDSRGASPQGAVTYTYTPTANTTKHFLFGMLKETGYDVAVQKNGDGNYIVSVSDGLMYTSTAGGVLTFEILDGYILPDVVFSDGFETALKNR